MIGSHVVTSVPMRWSKARGKRPHRRSRFASLRAQRLEAVFEEALVIHAGPCWLPLLGRRVSAGLLTWGGCGKVVDRTLHPIAYTIVPHRRHRVVVGGVRFQTLQAHPKNRLRMGLVEPDVIFRCLAQIVGIRTVVCDRPMIVIPARVGRGPSDDARSSWATSSPGPLVISTCAAFGAGGGF
jgi:hypothetical protein